MLSRLCCGVALLAALGCSSSEFKVNSDVGAVDDTGHTIAETSVGDSGVVEDSPAEVAPPGPCDAEEGKAKYCIEITAAPHPLYEASSKAPDVGSDGTGKLVVLLYDKDPLTTPGAKVIKSITHPSDTATMSQADFPVKLQGVVDTPGTYTVLAYFADSTKTRGDGKDQVLPGDLAVAPKLTGMVPAYPTATFAAGKVQTGGLQLKPVRRAKVIINAKATLKEISSNVHGDGPVIFGITDATSISETAGWLHYAQGGCVDLQIQSVAASGFVYFPVIGEGVHNVFVGVVDYSSTTGGWPGKGTLITPVTSAIPTIDIAATTWAPETTVTVTNVAGGATDGSGDLTCP